MPDCRSGRDGQSGHPVTIPTERAAGHCTCRLRCSPSAQSASAGSDTNLNCEAAPECKHCPGTGFVKAPKVRSGAMVSTSPRQRPDRKHRSRVLKGASILGTINDSEIRCTVRNMHEGGAELRVPADSVLRSKFLLYIPLDGIAYRAEVRWRTGDRVGVMFTGKEAKPHWHYG